MFQNSIILARIAGCPVRAHVTLLLFLPLMLAEFPRAQWAPGLAAAAGLFASLALHELGHVLAARRRGLRPREIVITPFGGLGEPDRPPGTLREELRIALAGPAVNLVLWLALDSAARVLGMLGHAPWDGVARRLSEANLLLGLFNFIPSFPLDGGRVLRAKLSPFLGALWATRLAAKIGRGFALGIGLLCLFFWRPFPPLAFALALLLYHAAGAEFRRVRAREMSRAGPGAGVFGWPGAGGAADAASDDDEIVVSPPPYARHEARERLRRAAPRWRERLDALWSPPGG